MWKPTFYVMWLLLVLLIYTVEGGPCCKDNDNMYLEGHAVKCVGTDEDIELYKNCPALISVDPSLPTESTFTEDENKTHFSFDNITWSDRYCTGIIVNKSNPTFKEHLALICFQEGDSPTRSPDTYILYACCQLVSIVFIISTLIVYLILPELRDLQGKCVMCFIASLAVGYISLSYMQLPFTTPESNYECIFFAFLTYFWLLSSFFWLNINSFNMWRCSVLAHIHFEEKKLFISYILAGWGIPCLFLAVAITTHNMPGDIIRPNFGVDKCWFQGKVELWSFFYGPVAILLVCNILYFLSTAWHLWSDYRQPTPINRIKSLRVKFGLYLKLFLTMGVTWIFEIVSYFSSDSFFWYFTDILNCLQGVIIFIVMIATRRRVWRALAKRKPCGVTCNRHWESMEDDETESPMIVDEQQLDNGKA